MNPSLIQLHNATVYQAADGAWHVYTGTQSTSFARMTLAAYLAKVLNKKPEDIKVYVHGCNVGAGGGNFTLFAWALTGTASNPFTSVPESHAVSIGQTDATTFGWSGLPAGNRYLGRVLYGDGATTFTTPTTQIEVSTR